jgi:hypothetical protein
MLAKVSTDTPLTMLGGCLPHLVKPECCPNAQVGLLHVLHKEDWRHLCQHIEFAVVLRLGGAQQVHQQATLHTYVHNATHMRRA